MTTTKNMLWGYGWYWGWICYDGDYSFFVMLCYDDYYSFRSYIMMLWWLILFLCYDCADYWVMLSGWCYYYSLFRCYVVMMVVLWGYGDTTELWWGWVMVMMIDTGKLLWWWLLLSFFWGLWLILGCYVMMVLCYGDCSLYVVGLWLWWLIRGYVMLWWWWLLLSCGVVVIMMTTAKLCCYGVMVTTLLYVMMIDDGGDCCCMCYDDGGCLYCYDMRLWWWLILFLGGFVMLWLMMMVTTNMLCWGYGGWY